MSKTQIFILWGLAIVVVIGFIVLGQVISRPSVKAAPVQQKQSQMSPVAKHVCFMRGAFEKIVTFKPFLTFDSGRLSAGCRSFPRLNHSPAETTLRRTVGARR